MRKKASLLLYLLAISTLCSCQSTLSNSNDTEISPTNSNDIYYSEQLLDTETTLDSTNIEYIPTSLNEIYQVYKENRLKAEEIYIGQYVSVTANVFEIYNSSISLHEYQYGHDNVRTGFDSAWCKIVNDSLKEKMLALQTDDIITVKGKITSLTSTGDFQVSIDTYIIE